MKILFAAMAQSVHTARWIKHISETGWDMHVFDFVESSVCNELEGVFTHTVHPPPSEIAKSIGWESSYPFRRGAGLAKRLLPAALNSRLFSSRVKAFVELYRRFKPDILHSLEMQNESYPILDARELLGSDFSAPWIYSSWGSDIYFYGKDESHSTKIRKVLAACDYHIADCERDVRLAREFGFSGTSLDKFLTGGGYDVAASQGLMESQRPSRRKSIALKGYQHVHGRALVAVEALGMISDHLKGFTLELYLPTESVVKAAQDLAVISGIDLKVWDQTRNIEILKILGRSRIGLALSVSDGSPNTMIEAMMMGAFPIQSDTVSTREWIEDGFNGILVPPEDPRYAAEAVLRALSDDDLVDTAVSVNREMMFDRVDSLINQPKIIGLYDRVYSESKGRKSNN